MPSALAQVESSAEKHRTDARNVLARTRIHIPMAMGKIGSSADRERILSQAGTDGEQAAPPIRDRYRHKKAPACQCRGWGLLWQREICPPRLVAPAPAPACRCRSRADRLRCVYLRDAQAYMLISMPTCTSTIFGVFQAIGGLPQSWRNAHAGVQRKTSSEATQGWNGDRRLGCGNSDSRYFARGQGHFPLGQNDK